MARLVREIMNPDVFRVHLSSDVRSALNAIIAMRITAAPVVDRRGALIGVVSLRDLVWPHRGPRVVDCMVSPPLVIDGNASIEQAARTLDEAGVHHLPVVDAAGELCGFLSALDVVRGLAGLPRQHPSSFTHVDRDTGLVWSHDYELTAGQAHKIVDEPGLLMLVAGGVGVSEAPMWCEVTDDLRDRVVELCDRSCHGAQPAKLAGLLARGSLRFRVAVCRDRVEAQRALQTAREHIAEYRPQL